MEEQRQGRKSRVNALAWLATEASQKDTAWQRLCAKSRRTPTSAPPYVEPPATPAKLAAAAARH